MAGRVETTSPTWGVIMTHVKQRSATATASLEAKGATDAEYWRGYIKALREIEDLAGVEQPRFDEGAGDYGI